jgi:hypothetical protein
MNRIRTLLLLSLVTLTASAQRRVSPERMAGIYGQVRTPYKYGLVLAPETNDYKIDCPTVFRHQGKWYMTFLIYNGRSGKDGRGYETWLAESDNLLEWSVKGRLLAFRDGAWDASQRGGFPALPDMEWGGGYTLQPWKGRYWMTYIGGPNPGYETGPLSIGLAWTDGKNLGEAVEWEAPDKPILAPTDKDAQWFEQITAYKSTVYWDKKETFGVPFVMFYNAGGRHPQTGLKGERVGIALSGDMKRWKRYEDNPVFAHEAEGTITGDAHIQKFDDVYVMFYFSAFNPSRRYKAYNTFACSYDLVHWTDWEGDDLIVPSKDYDDLFAHKSYVINHEGVVYHFYCATNQYDQRGIAVATSKPVGRSAVRFPAPQVESRRTVVELKEWETCMVTAGREEEEGWRKVAVPHNWDDYYGYRQLTHGNLHGTALYRTTFGLPDSLEDKAVSLCFSGVGTYATVTLNGKDYGRHPVGRTSLTLDVTGAVRPGRPNLLEVKAEHPEMISDMPWVCGGCSSEWGFSEGSQPLGLFRPVELVITDHIRIEPFGVHVWNDDKAENVYIDTEVKNYGSTARTIEVVNRLNTDEGRQVFRLVEQVTLAPGETKVVRQCSPVRDPIRWDTENPYLYRLVTMIKRDARTTDEVTTPFGIRTVSWPVKRKDGDGRFFLNGKPVFINGVCEYEHQFGQSHAFGKEQVKARVKQILAAGFNAFRDAHQPHHTDYHACWDKEGVLFWTQFSAHVWYDTPEFRDNFRTLLRRWVKERRNSPSLVIWGLQNESVLPRAFAEECCDIIREMDPTAHNMRVITTCNGGEGTDWNVVQNWSGTYGGDPSAYDRELSREDQLLNGEYGAWRSIDLHTEPGVFEPDGVWSEDRMCRLMETKIRLAEQVRDSVCGHFQWIYGSHDNPGRRQPDEAYRVLDKVGPFNYKGLTTPWEEPLDVYYMYRSNYVSAAKDPMVYIVSHTWPDRFAAGRRQAAVDVYSNCDSVCLYNAPVDSVFLGCRRNGGIGTHLTWENRDIRYNVLRAVGYYGGRPVAEDLIILNGLERAPCFDTLYAGARPILKGEEGHTYLYRVNCGGDACTDEFGQRWMQDNTSVSRSWAEDFEGLNPYLASQRVTHDPVRGARDWELFQSFRFGRHKLEYRFPVADGRYRIELYFIEPWHGAGGGASTDCEGLRIFDVAVGGETVIDDLDIWAEAGHDGACKKVVHADVKGGLLTISFPEVKAGQALISAIAISAPLPFGLRRPLVSGGRGEVAGVADTVDAFTWKAAGAEVLEKTPVELLPEDRNTRACVTYEAESALPKGRFTRKEHRKLTGIFFGKGEGNSLEWNVSTGLAQEYALRFRYMNTAGRPVAVRLQCLDQAGAVLKDDRITFPEAPEKWRLMSTTTGTYINAGHYRILLSAPDMNGLAFDALDVQ